MTEQAGLTPVEHFVLHESDGDAPLPEIADAWRDTGEEPRSVDEAVPVLANALVALAADGLVEVHRFRTWPAGWDGGEPVDGDGLATEVHRTDTWLPGPFRDGLLVARVTDAGSAHL